jgi:hypothetical protein
MASERDDPGRGVDLRRIGFPLGLAVIAAAKVWLDGGLLLIAHSGQTYDDALYAKLAWSILRGEWLGPFDQLTLVKNPFFPIWIAVVHWLHAPLFLAQATLYVAAGALFAWELAQEGTSRAWALAVFAAYALNPFVEVRLLREGIYGSLLVATIALGARLARRIRSGAFAPGAAASLGIAFSAAWLTREEGTLLWVTVAAVLLPAGVAAARSRALRSWLRPAAASFAVGLAVIAASLGSVAWANLRAYGVFRVNDHTAPPFTSALGALYSVEHPHPIPYRVVPLEVRAQLYRESPAFGSLLPFIDGRDGSRAQREGWRRLTCAIYPSACGDYGGCWFDWTLRLAVSDAGHYRTASEADAFYLRLHDEIAAACDQGRLRCTARHDTVVPPLRGAGWGDVLRYTLLGGYEVLTFPLREYVFGDDARSECDPDGCHSFELLTRSPAAPPREAAGTGDLAMARDARRRLGAWIGDRYIDTFGVTIVLGVLALAGLVLRGAIQRRWPRHVVIMLTLLASVAVRLGMLAYIETTWFPAFTNWPNYITPLYPLMILFAGTALSEAMPDVARALMRWVRPLVGLHTKAEVR